jgi:hypothetical protein
MIFILTTARISNLNCYVVLERRGEKLFQDTVLEKENHKPSVMIGNICAEI